MIQRFFTILLIGACAYMCASVVFWSALTKNVAGTSHWILSAYHICPWLLAYLSIKGWYHSYVWRRMTQNRRAAPTLSRGEYRFDVQPKRTGILERLSLIFLALALCALREIWL